MNDPANPTTSVYLGKFKISVAVHFTILDFHFLDIDCHQMRQPRFRVDLFKEKDLDLGWVFPPQMESQSTKKNLSQLYHSAYQVN